jgi:hypothetical protein
MSFLLRRLLPAATLLLPALPARAPAQALQLSIIAGDSVIPVPAIPPGGPVRGPALRVRDALRWRVVRPGLEVATATLRAGALGLTVQATLVLVDPARLAFALQHAVEENGMTGRWTIDSAGGEAVLAMNAGQFKETGPWGWLVMRGEELRDPGRAPLGIGIRIDTAGRIRWVPPGREAQARMDPGTAYAFQSFPLLFYDRRVPPLLRDASALRLSHRDARLVLAEQDDGRALVLLTRYAGLSPVAERIPIGLTTPETVALLAALGARHAVMLDGGVSAQLRVREATGVEHRWAGLRRVPLGIVAVPRGQH